MLIVVERCGTFHHYYPIGVYTPLALTVTNKLLETLYHSLYTPLEQAELQSEISSCHHQLTEQLGKSEHKLLLKMVDDYDHLVDVRSMDSFLCGLKLGLELAYGLKHYDGHLLGDEAEEDVRRSISE